MFTFFPPLEIQMLSLAQLWLASGAGLAVFALIAIRHSGRLTLRRLSRDQSGGAYSISLLMTLPVFVTLLTLFVECNSLMLHKIGSVYSAYAATRSAVVWYPIDKQYSEKSKAASHLHERLERRCHLAAAKALAPFASGKELHGPDSPSAELTRVADEFAAAYETHAEDTTNKTGYFQQKFLNAYHATKVEVAIHSIKERPGLSNIAVTVHYDAPLLTPGIGLFLGKLEQPLGRFYQWSFASTMVMGIEEPLMRPNALVQIIDEPLNTLHPDFEYSIGVRYGEDLIQK